MLAEMQERVQRLAPTIRKRAQRCATEEATKMSVIVPVLQEVLGYDCHDPDQVIPEYTADFGSKKAEKVDYALMRHGQPVVLVEAKAAGAPLDAAKSQIYRYFSTTGDTCRTAILTNGTLWHFYGDLDDRNKLDRSPCFTFDFNAFEADEVENLQIVCHDSLDDPDRIDRMRELRYQREIGIWLDRQFADPDEEFVAFLAKQIHGGLRTKNVLATFKAIIPRALRARRNRAIGDRLRRAMVEDTVQPVEKPPEAASGNEAAAGGKRKRWLLTVWLNGQRYSTEDANWDGPRVMITTLEELWRTPEGRAAIERTTPENGYLRESRSGFKPSTKPLQVKPDGPWLYSNTSHAVRGEILDAVRDELPEAMRGTLSYEIKPAGGAEEPPAAEPKEG